MRHQLSEMDVGLRQTRRADAIAVHTMMRDPQALHRAGLAIDQTPDLARFTTAWEHILRSSTVRVVIVDQTVVGQVAIYGSPQRREVTGWFDRAYWGRGMATIAMRKFLREVPERPLVARTAITNVAAQRVLEKLGFRQVRDQPGSDEGELPHHSMVEFVLS